MSCPANLDPLPGATSRVTLSLAAVAGAHPFEIDGELSTDDQARYRISGFRFYIAEPVLIDETGSSVAGQLIDDQGVPRKYGLQLLNWEEPESLTVHLNVPAGRYRALSLGVGVPGACNSGDPTRKDFPLNVDAGMYWPWVSKYIFVRVDGSKWVEQAWTSFFVHMGFDQLYRKVEVPGAIHATSPTEPARRLVVDVARLLRGAGAERGDGGHLNVETWMAENIASGQFMRLE